LQGSVVFCSLVCVLQCVWAMGEACAPVVLLCVAVRCIVLQCTVVCVVCVGCGRSLCTGRVVACCSALYCAAVC